MTAEPARRRGRRPAGEDLRGAIVAAARTEFSAKGFDATTLRGVARVAGVDPRLVHHYFDGKEALFVAAFDLPVRPADMLAPVLAAGPDGIGERIVRLFFTVWDTPAARQRIIGLLGAAVSSPAAARMVREFLSREVFGRVTAALGTDDPELRANLVASQLIGIVVMRYIVEAEPLASADVEDLVPLLAPTLQRYLTGE